MDVLTYLSNNKKNNNNDIDNDILFYRVWRNIIIRNEILLYVRLYNMHSLPISVKDVVNQLPNYKLNGYLKAIHINSNIKLGINSLPYGLEYISFSFKFNQLIVKGMIPDTVKTIEFTYFSVFNQTLDGNWLPPSLTSLKFGRSFQQPIKVGHLPNSLTNLQLYNYYEGTIEQGALPKSLIAKGKSSEFGYYKFNSNNNNNKITNYSIPKSTTKLDFDNEFKQLLKIGDVPHNVTSLKIYSRIPDLEAFVLPQSITHLSLIEYSFNEPKDNILPPNLTYLSINQFSFKPTAAHLPKSITTLILSFVVDEIDAVSLLPNLTTLEMDELEIPFQQATSLFPKSLTSIRIEESEDIPFGFFINHTNLKKLITSTIPIPPLTLPSSLTELHLMLNSSEYLNQNQNSLVNIDSLTSLTNLQLLGMFNDTINFNYYLPSSITSLTLGSNYNQPINNNNNNNNNNNVLPNNLKELYILNPSFNQYIPTDDDDNHLPKSLQSIIISPENYKLLNNLNLNFILKFIKFNEIQKYERDNY